MGESIIQPEPFSKDFCMFDIIVVYRLIETHHQCLFHW